MSRQKYLLLSIRPPERAKLSQERWESGLIHQFAKLAYSIRVPGVRIPPSPQAKEKITRHASSGRVFCFTATRTELAQVRAAVKQNHGDAKGVFMLFYFNCLAGSPKGITPVIPRLWGITSVIPRLWRIVPVIPRQWGITPVADRASGGSRQ